MLGDGQRDAGHVRFLKRIRADQRRSDLPGDAHDRRRVHHGRGDAGDQIGRAGAGGGHRHADFAGGAGVTVGHVRRALLVPDQDVVNLRILAQRIVEGQNRPAGIPKHQVHAFAEQTFKNNFCAGEFHRFSPVPVFACVC